MSLELINQTLIYLTFGLHIILTVFLIAILWPKCRVIIFEKIKILGLYFAFIIVLTATLGSLFYSELMDYAPCELCWYQRIFMYPMVLLIGLVLILKEKAIVKYLFPLLVSGLFISIYHNFVYYNALSTPFCADGAGVSCSARYIFGLGYITIPLMSLTAFLATGILLYLYIKK